MFCRSPSAPRLVATRSRGVTQEDKLKRLFAVIHGRSSTKRAISSQRLAASQTTVRKRTVRRGRFVKRRENGWLGEGGFVKILRLRSGFRLAAQTPPKRLKMFENEQRGGMALSRWPNSQWIREK